MIDYAARRQMGDIIRSYLNEEIKAFQFSDALYDVAGKTKDSTVQQTVDALWYLYDDVKDHKIVASKEEWDFFHRLLLILESDAEIEVSKVRKWSLRQLIAAFAMVTFVMLALHLSWGPYLLGAYIALGLVSMLLWYSRSRATPKPDATEIALTPFSSISQLLAIRRRVPHFLKERYPTRLATRRIRHWIFEMPMPLLSSLVVGAIWSIFAPVPLLFQAMPKTRSTTRIRIAQESQEITP